ncbi:MAG: bifunctional enoyl-CoA hydratase/phosphate acetyltransferase [Thermodesulfobacteriota bacterium]
MAKMSNTTFKEIEIGASATLTRTLSKTDIEVLALVSGDANPFHIKSENDFEVQSDASATQGVGAEALVSAALGTQLPGPGMKIIGQDLRFYGTIAVGDKLTATVTAKEKRRKDGVVLFDCRCVNQNGEELVSGTVTVSAPTKKISYSEIAPPQLVLRRGDAFIRLLKACEEIPPVVCAVVHPCDKNSLLGPIEAAKRGIIEPVLVGPEQKIRTVAEAERVDLSPYRIVSTLHSHEAAEKAVELARAGEVEALMKGSLHTDELMAPIVPSATGLRTSRRISHVFVMDVPSYPRMLLITDAAINIYPKLEEKADIVQNAIDLAHALGIEEPRVAILSAVETVNPKIESTIDAAALCKMADRGQITGGILDGPLAFDNAISEEAARTKHIVSPVAGFADILLVPDLEAGNMLAKQLSYLAGAESGGIVLGTRVPIVLTSRADSVRSRLASAAVMALVAHARRTGKFAVS